MANEMHIELATHATSTQGTTKEVDKDYIAQEILIHDYSLDHTHRRDCMKKPYPYL
jgi:hypothetical protein